MEFVKILLVSSVTFGLYSSDFLRAIALESPDKLATRLQSGVNVNATDSSGNTALMLIIGLRGPDIAEFLLASGANPNMVNNAGDTVLSLVLNSNLHDQVKREFIKLLLKYGVNAATDEGVRALLWAAEHNFDDIIELLKGRIDVSSKAAHDALVQAVVADDIYLVALLLNLGVDPEANRNPLRPLARAALNNNLKIIQLLLQAGADINGQGTYPPGTAVENSTDKEIVRLLIKMGAEVNKVNQSADLVSQTLEVSAKDIQDNINREIESGFKDHGKVAQKIDNSQLMPWPVTMILNYLIHKLEVERASTQPNQDRIRNILDIINYLLNKIAREFIDSDYFETNSLQQFLAESLPLNRFNDDLIAILLRNIESLPELERQSSAESADAA